MITIIAEKPSVGKELANFIGAQSKRDGYYEGNGYYVTWAFGHLLEIKNMKELGFDGDWNINNLPFIPVNYNLKLKNDSGVIKQYNILNSLIGNSTEIICATDAGREGELIFRYIYEFSKSTKPIKRLWVSSLTQEALSKAFNNLKPGDVYLNLYNAAKSRNQADYLVGLNATMALTSKANIGLLSLGRVQTPTLALICERFKENKEFTPQAYFKIKIELNKDKQIVLATSIDQWNDRVEVEKVFDSIKNLNEAYVENIVTKEVKENPPLLFDLTTLQQDANKKFGFTASDTLEIAQELYESKYITYPRTGSCFIGEDLLSEIPFLIKKLQSYTLDNFNNVPSTILETKLNTRSVNSSKVTDHHALLTTEIIPLNFSSEKHKNLYQLIASRMLEAFCEVCVKDITKILLSVSNINFESSGTIIKSLGWRAVRKELKNEDSVILPIITEGENLIKENIVIQELFTKPKPLHNEASILGAMETCGKNVEDEELKEALKENGIGTPATRASILEVLIKRNYILREKKSLIPTSVGLQVYELVKDINISKAILTGEWENKLLKMEKGNYDYNHFKSEIENYTKELVSLLSNLKISFITNTFATCPNCKGNIAETYKAFSCENNNSTCNFPTIWKIIGKKEIQKKDIEDLINKGKTNIIKGFKNKENKTFDATLKIENNTVVYDFTKNNLGKCPKCKEGIVEENLKSYSCDRYKDGCDFTIWKEIASKKITRELALKIISGEPTNLIKGFKGNTNNFDAYLILNEENKVVFKFK